MNCENCKRKIPQDECPNCEECAFIWQMYMNNTISHNERVERLQDQRIFAASANPGYIQIPASVTGTSKGGHQ